MASYTAQGFAFNRDNIKGIGADMRGGLNRFLAARERELNTFELETLACSGGPLDGQTIELTAPDAMSAASHATCAELMKTAVFTLRGMTGHYQKYIGTNGSAAVWIPEGGELPQDVTCHRATPQATKAAAPVKLGRGFVQLAKFLANLAEEPETVEHAGQVFALFKIGRTQYRIKNTPEAIEKLRAAVLKKKKWFADKFIDAPRETQPAPDAIHARAAQDVAKLIAQATQAAQQESTPAQTLQATPEPVRELATVGADLETAQATPTTPPHQLHGALIAQTLRETCDKTTTDPAARAALYTRQAQRIEAAGDAMRDRAGHATITHSYHAAAGILHSMAGQLRAVDNSAPAGGAGGGRWIKPATTGSSAVPNAQTTPTPARPRDQAATHYTKPRETLHAPAPVDKPEPAQGVANPAGPHYTEGRRSQYTQTSGLHATPQDLTWAMAGVFSGQAIARPQTRAATGGAIMPAMTYPEHMTGAELQTLREACGLDREEFADLASVQPRTLKHWENGRAGVPADVAQLARELDAACTQGAAAMLERAQFEAQGAPDGVPVVLVRYKTPADMPQGHNMPAGLQGAMVARVRLELLRKGRAVRVVWHDAAHGGALQQLQAQAVPHRGDQPPAA